MLINPLTSCVRLICYSADNLSAADAINKAKEFAENVGNIDRLCDENIELNKLNQSMSAELKTAKESLLKAEQAWRPRNKYTLTLSVKSQTGLINGLTSRWLLTTSF